MTVLTEGAAYRLPRTVTPTRYDLELRVDPTVSTFDGTVDIAVIAHQPVNEIVLNANCLTDIAATIRTADGASIEVSALTLDAETERLHLRLVGELPPGAHSIRLTFRAQLSDDMEGMYRST